MSYIQPPETDPVDLPHDALPCGEAARVNFWARLIQSLGVPPAGFSAECSILNLDSYEHP